MRLLPFPRGFRCAGLRVLLALASAWALPPALYSQTESAAGADEATGASLLSLEDPGTLPPEAIEASLAADTLVELLDEPGQMLGPQVLVDESAQQVLKRLSDLLDRPHLPASDLPVVKINFDSLGPISQADMVTAMESLLAMHQVLVVPMGDGFLRAVTLNQPNAKAPDLLQVPALSLRPSEQVYSRIYQLEYASLEPVQQAITNSALKLNQLVTFPQSNAMLITDSVVNLQRVERLLSVIDAPPTVREEVRFYQITNTAAQDLRDRLLNLQSSNSPLAAYLEGNLSVEADERTNQLIVVTHPANFKLIEQFVESLDVDVAPITRSEVFSIKHAVAEEVAAVIQEVVSGQQQARERERQDTPAVRQRDRQQPEAGQQQQQQQPAPQDLQQALTTAVAEAAQNEALQFSEFVTIVHDERSNAIVVYGTASDIQQVGSLIEQIDVLLAQVRIEVIIAEVTLSEDDARGIDNFSFSMSDTSTFDLDVNNDSNLPITFSGNLTDFDLDLVFETAKSDSDVRVLSAPTIVTTHNQEASIIVAEQRPFVTSTATDLEGDDSTTRSTVEFRDIGIELTVTPRIGDNGVIQMEIEQVVDDLVDTVSIDGNPQPIVGRREATSFVSVRDQETIVLGGLQEDSFNRSNGRLAVFGRLPLLGPLFGSFNESKIRRELVIFIKPFIIEESQDNEASTERSIRNLRSRENVEQFLDEGTFDTPEPEPEPERDLIRRGLRR